MWQEPVHDEPGDHAEDTGAPARALSRLRELMARNRHSEHDASAS
jgi:hypothetical protein